ncbi:AraC family transcriptional regulator [Mameliella alba]|uniref:helix-turn-helix transcriptional regulator n=1 Tax=Mameliella alba TaxID=561184 RepID=UPI0015517DD4|nr:AraC family transcriptional regulator [Mameliella alba]
MRSDPHSTAGSVRAGTFSGSLQPRVVGLAESLTGPSWLAFLLEAGSARLSGEEPAIAAPALVWRPWMREARAVFQAGAAGTYVLLGPTALANAVGHMPETRELREMADRPVTAPLPREGASFEAMRAAFRGLSRDLGSEAAAAHAVVGAYLRVILIEVYRAGRSQQPGRGGGSPGHRVFADYGALVEAHFRDRWTVEDYAAALGVSRDRLGDICRRVRGIGPKALIDRRVALEARLQLENSSNSIQQVAGLLGFASAAQFNRFFCRVVGRPPGAYRAAYRAGAQAGVSQGGRPFEWP